MKEKFLIYGMYDPRDGELRYVGKTSRGEDRFWEHTRREAEKKNRHGYWLKKLAGLNTKPVFAPIQVLSSAGVLNEAEIYWIAFFKSAGCRLTNASTGGEGGGRGVVMTQATKDKIAAIHRGMKHSPETLAKMSAKGKARSPEMMAKAFSALARAWAKPVSSETRAKMSASRIGKPRRLETMVKVVATKKIRRANGEYADLSQWVEDHFGATFSSAAEAAKFHGMNRNTVHSALTRPVKNLEAISFRYVERAA